MRGTSAIESDSLEKYRDLSNHAGIIYTFYTERGKQELTYGEYLADHELRALVNDTGRYRLILGRTIFSYTNDYLRTHQTTLTLLRDMEEEKRKNPLRFFAPSGKEALAFLNDWDNDLCILTACNRFGKALDDDTIIPTPYGDIRIADLKVGDIVYGGSGSACEVSGVFPQGKKECYKVEFDNGEVSLVASGDHLWKYLRHNRAFKSRSKTAYDEWEVLTTNEILSLQGEKSTSQNRGYIPLAGLADNDAWCEKQLPIPPYSLGVIIGDGCLAGSDVRVSSDDPEIIERVERELGAKANFYGGYDYGLTGCEIGKNIRNIGMNGKRSWEKFIPQEYLIAPVDDRIDLLRGLMDTDGCISFRGGEFCTVSELLARDVERLVRSLGGSAKTSVCEKYYTYKGKRLKGRIAYRVRVLLWDINPFWVKRKHNAWKFPTRRRGRLVYKITPVGLRECTCISVTSSDNTFLAGDYVVTHNTQTMLVKKLINSIPCDPNWEIFSKYGVTYRPFYGPKNVGLSTYDFGFHRDTTLPMLLDWIPEKELGVYARAYKGKGAKQVNLNNVPILPLECGTKFYFAATSQGQNPYEGNVKHDWGWDEQGTEPNFDGADERTRTVSDGRHDFALTPHAIDGRPDTGAGSWINKIYEGEITKGRSIGRYQGQVWDVPDWIYPESAKVQAFNKWVIEPQMLQDDKKRREGLARFFGNWHEASGLVIDEWNSEKHIIEPFEIPPHWTRFRGLDDGNSHGAGCVWAAMSPGGDLFFYRDYMRRGLVPSQIARDVIEMSGNGRRKIGSYRNPQSSSVYDRFEEVQKGEGFQWTKMDARAFSAKNRSDQVTYGTLYKLAGLEVKQGSGHDSDHYVPILKEWFAIDPEKKHFVTGELGAPRVYIFSTCKTLIKQIKGWVWKQRKTRGNEPLAKMSPRKKDDELCDAMKLVIQGNPRFIGNPRLIDSDWYDFDDDWVDETPRVDGPINPITGY